MLVVNSWLSYSFKWLLQAATISYQVVLIRQIFHDIDSFYHDFVCILLICGIVLLIGDVKVVLNEGMPHYKNIDINGRLIIEFKVSVNFFRLHLIMNLFSTGKVSKKELFDQGLSISTP